MGPGQVKEDEGRILIVTCLARPRLRAAWRGIDVRSSDKLVTLPGFYPTSLQDLDNVDFPIRTSHLLSKVKTNSA